MTVKTDEVQLFMELKKQSIDSEFPYVREIVATLGMAPKRAAYICQKWTTNKWYNYGCNVLAGWLTPEAPEHL